jgi:ABC-type uncharacterized transport system permease subunit
VHAPFSHDLTPQVRFLFALPLMILADLIIGPHVTGIAAQFVSSGLVPERCIPEFDSIAQAAIRLPDSNTVEIVVIVIAYTPPCTTFIVLGTGESSWLASATHAGLNLTLAGWWSIR